MSGPRSDGGLAAGAAGRGTALLRLLAWGFAVWLGLGVRLAPVHGQGAAAPAATRGGGASPEAPDDSKLPEFTIRRVPVGPVPEGYVPVQLSEFEAARAAALRRPSPRGLPWRHAVFRAVYGPAGLTAGTFEIDVAGPAQGTRLVPVEPLGLALANVAWSDRPAIFGTAEDGRTWLRLERPHDRLAGRFELRGEPLGDATVFRFEMPAAATARLELDLPSDLAVSCYEADLAEGPSAAGVGHRRWNLEFGGRSAITFFVRTRPTADLEPPLVVTRQEVACIVREEGVRLVADFTLQPVRGSVRTVEMALDDALEPYSVTTNRNEPVPYRIENSSPRRLIAELPWEVPEAGQILHVAALTPLPADETWIFPRIHVLGSPLADGRIVVRVQKPLQVQGFRIEGGRQTALESGDGDEETLLFRQFSPEMKLHFDIGRPALRLNARVLNSVRFAGSRWELASRIVVSSSSGETFLVRCRLPQGWTLLDVRAPADEADLIDWAVSPQPDLTSLAEIQFRESLAPGRDKTIELQAARSDAGPGDSMPIPCVLPTGVREAAALVHVASDPSLRPILEPGGTFQSIDAGALGPEWTEREPFAQRTADDRRGLWLQLNGNVPEGSLFLQPMQTPIDARAETTVVVRGEEIEERMRLEVRPVRGRLERLLIYVGEEGGLWRWTLDREDRAVDAVKHPLSRHAVWDVPPRGELWELRLPVAERGPFAVTGLRTRPAGESGGVAVPVVLEAVRFEGRIAVQSAEPSLVAWEPDAALRPAPEPIADFAADETWQYGARAVLRYARQSAAGARRTDALQSVSVLARCGSTSDGMVESRLTIVPGTAYRGPSLKFALPAGTILEGVRIGRAAFQPQRSGADGSYELPLPEPESGEDEQTVVIDYRSPLEGHAAPVMNWRPVLPVLDAEVLSFTWRCETPPALQLARVRRGDVAVTRGHSDRSLEAWFGPFARRTARPFQFWRLRDWAELTGHAPLPPESPRAARLFEVAGAGMPEDFELVLCNRERMALLEIAALMLMGGAAVALRVARTRSGSQIVAESGSVVRTAASARTAQRFAASAAVLAALSLGAAPVEWRPAVTLGWLGLLLGCSLPNDSLRRLRPLPRSSDEVPAGSTVQGPDSLGGTWGACLLGAALLWCTVPLKAQTVPPAAASEGVADAVVLVPEDAEGRSVGLAYLKPQLWFRLQPYSPASEPGVLLASVQYNLEEHPAATCRGVARFDLIVLAPHRPCRVKLPLGDVAIEPDGLLVDGRPWRLELAPDGDGFMLDLPPSADPSKSADEGGPLPPEAPLPAPPDGAPAVAAAPPAVARHTVELRLHPRLVPERNSVSMKIPRVAQAALSVSSDERTGFVDVTSRRGLRRSPNPSLSGSFEASLGAVAGFELVRNESGLAGMLPRGAPSVPEVRSQILIAASPMLHLLTYRVAYAFPAGGEAGAAGSAAGPLGSAGARSAPRLDQLRWRVPRGCALRRLVLDDVLDAQVVPLDERESLFLVRFSQPRTASFQAEAEFVWPNPRGPEEIALPCPLVVGAGDETARLLSQFVAVRTPPEFELGSLDDVGEQVAEAAPQAFVDMWGDVAPRPQRAYRVFESTLLKTRLATLVPRRQIRERLSAWVGPRHLEFTLVCDVAVRRAPAFVHRITLDPRWVLRQVSVIENSAQRMLRWTRRGREVTIFLQGPTTGTQTILLNGVAALAGPMKLDLPRVDFENGEMRERQITLFQDPDINVELADAAAWEPVDEAPPAPPLPGLHVGTYRARAEPATMTLRTERNLPEIQCDLTLSVRRIDQRWRLRYHHNFRVLQGHGARFVLRVPPELAPFDVAAAGARVVQERESDGAFLVTIIPGKPIRDRLAATVTANIPRPTDSAVVLPDILPINAHPGINRLLLQGLDDWSPHDSVVDQAAQQPAEHDGAAPRRANAVARIRAEAAVREFADSDNPAARLFQGDARLWRLVQQSPPIAAATDPLRVEHEIWGAGGSTARGRSLWLLPPAAPPRLRLSIPDGMEVRAVLADGMPCETLRSDGELAVAVNSPQFGAAVVVHWQMPAPGRVVASWPLPRLTNLNPSSVEVSLPELPGRVVLVWPRRQDRLAVARAAALTELLKRQSDAGQSIQEPTQVAAARLAATLLGTAGSAAPGSREEIARYNVELSEVTGIPITPGLPDFPHTNPLGLGWWPSAGVACESTLPANASQVSVILLPVQSVRLAVGAVVALAFLLMLRLPRLGRLAVGLLQRRETLQVAAAALWWACLTPSWLGLLLLAVPLLGPAVRRLRRSRHDTLQISLGAAPEN